MKSLLYLFDDLRLIRPENSFRIRAVIVGDQHFSVLPSLFQYAGNLLPAEITEYQKFLFLRFSGIGKNIFVLLLEKFINAFCENALAFSEADQLLVVIENRIPVGQGLFCIDNGIIRIAAQPRGARCKPAFLLSSHCMGVLALSLPFA